MDSLNRSSKSSLLQEQEEDRISSIRRRNKTLILVFFSLIISLALIIGGMIVSLVHKHNFDLQNEKSARSNLALQEFCAVSGFQFSCISTLSSTIKITPDTNPSQIFTLSLEAAARKLADVVSNSTIDETGPQVALSLRNALIRLLSALEVMKGDPDVESLVYERRRDFTSWVLAAAEDLKSGEKELRRFESTAADEMSGRVHEVEVLVSYSGDFLQECDVVNMNYRFDLDTSFDNSGRVIENFLEVSLFGSQYVVLLLLFCLLLRIYRR